MPSANKAGFGTAPGQVGGQDLDADEFDSTGDVEIRQIDGLPFVIIYNADNVAHVVTCKTRGLSKGGQLSIPFNIAPGTCVPLPTTVFGSMADSLGNSNAYYFLSDVPLSGPRGAAGSGIAPSVIHNFGGASLTPSATGAFQQGGLGSTLTLTPTASGIVEVAVNLNLFAGAISDAVQVKISFGTGGAPALNAPAAGTASRVVLATAIAAIGSVDATAYLKIAGLTLGTTYWFDVQISIAAAGDTVIVGNSSVSELAA